MQPIDPFANLIPLDQMEEDIAYQMACDAGYDPEIHLNAVVEQRERALRAEIDDAITQLWKNVNQAITLFSELLAKVRSGDPYRAASMQTAQIAESVIELKAHKMETQKILKTLYNYLQEVQVQQRAYQEKLAALRAAKSKQAAHNAFASFVCDCGERYRQTMVYQSAGIMHVTPAPSFSLQGKAVDRGEIDNNLPKKGQI